MKELFGVLTSAQFEDTARGKRAFVTRVQPDDGEEWKFYIFDKSMQKACQDLVGRSVIAVTNKTDKGFWELVSIEGGGSAEPEVRESTPQEDAPNPYERADRIGREKGRCALIDSASRIAASRPDMSAHDVVIMAEVFEAWVNSPSLIELAQEMADEANSEAQKKAEQPSAAKATSSTKRTSRA